MTAEDGGVAIQAVGKNSASGLLRTINIDTQNCPILEWRWRVEKLQHNANLNDKKGEDVAASIFLLFGDPGFMSSPTPVPTLRYVWTNDRHSRGDVIENPYLPGVVQSVVIRAGQRGNWFTESRNLRQDYEQAFGAPPKAKVHAIVLFTDNDQTKEPAVAFYRWAKVHCDQAVSPQAQLPN